MSKPIHMCPFSDIVSPLNPDPQPRMTQMLTQHDQQSKLSEYYKQRVEKKKRREKYSHQACAVIKAKKYNWVDRFFMPEDLKQKMQDPGKQVDPVSSSSQKFTHWTGDTLQYSRQKFQSSVTNINNLSLHKGVYFGQRHCSHTRDKFPHRYINLHECQSSPHSPQHEHTYNNTFNSNSSTTHSAIAEARGYTNIKQESRNSVVRQSKKLQRPLRQLSLFFKPTKP